MICLRGPPIARTICLLSTAWHLCLLISIMFNQSQSIDFSVTNIGRICLIQLPARLSVVEAIAFKAKCKELMQVAPIPNQLILDCGQTTFIDSSGIGALVGCLKTTKVSGAELVLWSVQPVVMVALSLAELSDVLNIVADTEALLPGFTKQLQNRPPLTHPSVRSRFKRIIDIAGAILGLGITTFLFIPIAVAITVNNPGPIFFCQTRCGLMGRRFKLWKFRSMVVNAEAMKTQVENQVEGPFFKNAKDPRITYVGKFLRKTSLDELPQFWNVLKGEMSLVGTRPPTIDEVNHYEVPNWQRLDVKPGMTGEWQVNGRSKVCKFEDVIQLDLRYQQRWSLKYDFKLILQTVLVIFTKNTGAF
jgi:anti-anti-sigma factor